MAVSRRSVAEIAAGAIVLGVAAVFLAFAVLQSGRVTAVQEDLRLTARFDRIDGLALGADVRLAGVRVGSVTDARIDPASFAAEVSFRIDRALRLPADSSAEITSDGLLGGKYLSLVPGGSETVLADGGRITETQGAVSLESLLGRFIFSVTQMNAQQGAANEGMRAPAANAVAAPR
jgi:phospholipid/cholesterol/gamma-HCH transport system substrate-binding protein